jgi:hypothetical protein
MFLLKNGLKTGVFCSLKRVKNGVFDDFVTKKCNIVTLLKKSVTASNPVMMRVSGFLLHL